MCREIEGYPSHYYPHPPAGTSPSKEEEEISTLYFGWGTPGVLRIWELQKIFTSLKKKYTFSQNIEISFETTPDKITQEHLKEWTDIWINRISMWIQTLNEKSLDAIGRGGKWDIETALWVLQNGSISNISVDFIIGLPHVKKWEILQNIQYILKHYDVIQHISVYMLEDYYNEDKIIETGFDKKTYPDNWEELWIDESEYLEEYASIKAFLETQWFERYEISNFAKKWYECKHNKWYWNHSEIRAFWLGAYGLAYSLDHHQPLLPKEGSNYYRYSNSEKFWEYYEWKQTIQNRLSQEDIFLETVMFQLRTSWLEKDIYIKLDQEKLKYFISEKLLQKKSDKIVLSDSWVLLMDYILSEIV